MTTSFDTLRAKTAELQAQIAKLQAEAAEQVKPLLQQFIVDNPRVEAVRWTQFTPYFNDGDECVFSVNEPQFKFVGQEEGGDYEDGFFDLPYEKADLTASYYVGFWDAIGRDHAALAACRALVKELSGLDDALKSLFGDHVEVTVTKEGVEVEGYDHD